MFNLKLREEIFLLIIKLFRLKLEKTKTNENIIIELFKDNSFSYYFNSILFDFIYLFVYLFLPIINKR